MFARLSKAFIRKILFAQLSKSFVRSFLFARRKSFVQSILFARLSKSFVQSIFFARLSKAFVRKILFAQLSKSFVQSILLTRLSKSFVQSILFVRLSKSFVRLSIDFVRLTNLSRLCDLVSRSSLYDLKFTLQRCRHNLHWHKVSFVLNLYWERSYRGKICTFIGEKSVQELRSKIKWIIPLICLHFIVVFIYAYGWWHLRWRYRNIKGNPYNYLR